MKKVNEILESHFKNVFSILKEKNENEFLKKVTILKEDMYKVIDAYNSVDEADWEDVEERVIDLAKQFDRISSEKDLNTICITFVLLRKNMIFEKTLLKVLGKSKDDEWEVEDLRPAILTVLKEHRKEIKAKGDNALLERYDDLKDDIKKVISGDITSFKLDYYHKTVVEELKSDFWKDDDNIFFLSKAISLYCSLMCNQKIKSLCRSLREKR